jgi:hypothetical protein
MKNSEEVLPTNDGNGSSRHWKTPLIAGKPRIIVAFKIWLVLEICINLWFGFKFIPNFFAYEPFVINQRVNVSCKAIRTAVDSNGSSQAAIAHLMKVREELEKDEQNAEVDRKYAQSATKNLNSTAHKMNSSHCFGQEQEYLWGSVLKEMYWHGNPTDPPEVRAQTTFFETIPHKFNSCILFVCGLVAPLGEVIMRVINNLFYFAGRDNETWHMIYELSHGPLQHLTQFKLYLCFLQMLLVINVMGIPAMRMYTGPGVRDFVKFVAWSMFINTVVKKVEKPIKTEHYDKPWLPQILPPPEWLPKLLSRYTGHFSHLRTIASLIKIGGLWLFFTHPVFALVFDFEPAVNTTNHTQYVQAMKMCPASKDLKDVQSVKYLTHSFLSLRAGFVQMLQQDVDFWMVTLLMFQFFFCNLALPAFQLSHAVVQELVDAYRSRLKATLSVSEVGWKPQKISALPRVAPGKYTVYRRLADSLEDSDSPSRCLSKRRLRKGERVVIQKTSSTMDRCPKVIGYGAEIVTDDGGSSTPFQVQGFDRKGRRFAYWLDEGDVEVTVAEESVWKQVVTLFLQCCVENQAHEYFVCAIIMLVFIVITVFKSMELNRRQTDCGVFSVQICFNPLICLWLLASVPLLGRARAKLYIQFADAGSMVHWQWTPSKHKAQMWYYYLVVFWMTLVVFMGYVTVFSSKAVLTYFGKWTLDENYVIDSHTGTFFSCITFQGRDQQCISTVGGNAKRILKELQSYIDLMDSSFLKQIQHFAPKGASFMNLR